MPVSLVLDTSALMAIILEESEADEAEAAVRLSLRRGDSILMPFVVATELEYLLARKFGDSMELYLTRLQAWPADVVESNESWRHETARVKAAGNVSFADAWVAALGLLRDSPVLHKDPQFERISGLKTIDIRRRR